MATGPNRAQRRAEKRALSAPSNLVRMDEHREKQSLFGKDSPLPTLMRWRGEMWGSLTWSDVVSIMVQAESTGATETWARLTRRMYQDGKILAARSSRLDPIAGADFEVEPGGTDPIDIQAAKDCDLMLRSLPDLATTLDAILDAIMVGWSVNEIIWGVKGSWIWPSRIDTIEPHRIRFTETIEPYLYDDGRLMNDPGAIQSIRLLGKPLRENKYIVHMPRAVPEYAIAAGLCRPLVRYWWAKWQCIANWLSGSEVAGNPRTVGYYDDGPASGTTRTQLYNELVNISTNSTLVTSKNNKVEFVSPSAQGTGSVWSALADWADNGIVITVLGSTLNTEIDSAGGNRAAAESQGAYTIDPRLVKDSSAMWATIARDFLTPFLSFNDWRYGGRMPAIPKVKSRFREELEPKPSADLIDIGGATINEIRKRDGLAPRPDGEVIAKRAGGPMPAFGVPADTGAPADVAATALNGAQIASLQELLAAVQARTMAPEAATVAISNAFPSISAADAAAMVAAQAALPPVGPDGSTVVAPAAPLASTPVPTPKPGEAWTDTQDGHRLEVAAVDESSVWFKDLDDANPARQWRWARSHFTERCVKDVTQASAPPQPSAGGALAASPLAPWDLVERMTAQTE